MTLPGTKTCFKPSASSTSLSVARLETICRLYVDAPRDPPIPGTRGNAARWNRTRTQLREDCRRAFRLRTLPYIRGIVALNAITTVAVVCRSSGPAFTVWHLNTPVTNPNNEFSTSPYEAEEIPVAEVAVKLVSDSLVCGHLPDNRLSESKHLVLAFVFCDALVAI